jgi:hypothetical protein
LPRLDGFIANATVPAEVRDVLMNMHRLLTDGAAPDKRFGLKPKKNERGQCYWGISGQPEIICLANARSNEIVWSDELTTLTMCKTQEIRAKIN